MAAGKAVEADAAGELDFNEARLLKSYYQGVIQPPQRSRRKPVDQGKHLAREHRVGRGRQRDRRFIDLTKIDNPSDTRN